MTEPTDTPTPAPKSRQQKLLVAAAIIAVLVMALLNWPAKPITIEPPTLKSENTAEAYLANLDVIAAYAAELDTRKEGHPRFRQIRFADYAAIKSGAQRLLSANPALADDDALWTESQRTANALFEQLKTIDYALTANEL